MNDEVAERRSPEPPLLLDEGTAPPPEVTPPGPEATATEAAAPRTPTRLSATWTAVVIAVLVLILFVIFVAQNTQRSKVNFLWVHGQAPTAVVLLIAAIGGALIVIVVGVARILQLRRTRQPKA
jgi:uncharacterized integral membrane protein